nr:MAG TPA: hypothetical protein [Caudoviricetes sp.]
MCNYIVAQRISSIRSTVQRPEPRIVRSVCIISKSNWKASSLLSPTKSAIHCVRLF